MAFWNDLWERVTGSIAAQVVNKLEVEPIVTARAYRLGYYKPQLKLKDPAQFNDNLGLNFTGLIASRIVGQMFSGGVEFDFEDAGESEQAQYIKAVLDANKQEVLFHRCGTSASEAGTGYLFIIPGGVYGEDGKAYPRLQLIDPAFVKMDTLPEDYEMVIRYTITYKFMDVDGKEKAKRRVIEHNAPDETGQGNTWHIADFVDRNGRWEPVSDTPWPFDFAPIIHWQNLPSVASAEGEPDITASLIELQDRVNFVASNISKIIRYYAHPMRVGIGVTKENMSRVDSGPDQMVTLSDPESSIVQLDAMGDLVATMNYFMTLRQAFFDTARTVDIDSIGDKLGALTNFGLKVLYADNLVMIDTHRELFGDMLEELARRLMILNGMQAIPCEVKWPDFLPVNETEVTSAVEAKLRMGVLSKEGGALELGIDWEKEQERLEDERASQESLGAEMLRAFNAGGGGFETNRQPQRQPMNQQEQQPNA